MWSDIKTQLDRVSRSFALCIPLLEDGLKETIGISYLLLRALDSIEDSTYEREQKELLYKRFLKLIEEMPQNESGVRYLNKKLGLGSK